jgi:hypothetical protein
VCLFTHVAAGAVAGALAPNPFLASVFGLVSHVVLDIIPHYDFEKMSHEFLWAGVAVAAVAIGGAMSAKVALGIAFGMLPDLENLFWRLGLMRDDQKIFPGHRRLLAHGRATGAWNLSVQVAFAVCTVAFLIRRGA